MLKYITQVLHMLLYCRAEHKDDIKINSHATHQVGKCQINQTLECCRCIAQPYRNYKVLKLKALSIVLALMKC